MSEKEVEIREAEPVKSVRKELVRRSAKSEIILVELKSVVDKTSPIKTAAMCPAIDPASIR